MRSPLPWLGLLCVLRASGAEAFEINTHEELTTLAVHSSTTDAYLRNELGRLEGLNTMLVSGPEHLTFEGWVRRGTSFEDERQLGTGVRRHFHDPLKRWSRAGLKGLAEASVVHGSDLWTLARTAFRDALRHESAPERDRQLATMGFLLGGILHLLEDLVQPAHTRDDIHLLPSQGGIEQWMSQHTRLDGTTLLLCLDPLENAICPSTGDNQRSLTPQAPLGSLLQNALLTRLWDTEDSDLDLLAPRTSLDVGLAEYSNPNFVSEGTIFKDPLLEGGYAHPTELATRAVVEPPTPNIEAVRLFCRKLEGQPLDHFLFGNFGTLEKIARRLSVLEIVSEAEALERIKRGEVLCDKEDLWQLQPCGECYFEYATHLLPRAMGYSAALLNYFFRGKIDAQQASGNKITLTNHSGEAITGTFTFYYDTTNGRRLPVQDAAYSLPPLDPGESAQVDAFTPPTDPAPQEPGKYVLVFQGTLGAEPDAVVGKAVEILTPTLTVTLAGTGTGTITSSPPGINCGGAETACSANFPSGTQITLTASAAGNSIFASWSGCIGTGPCTITMNANETLVATFVLQLPLCTDQTTPGNCRLPFGPNSDFFVFIQYLGYFPSSNLQAFSASLCRTSLSFQFGHFQCTRFNADNFVFIGSPVFSRPPNFFRFHFCAPACQDWFANFVGPDPVSVSLAPSP